MMARVTGGQPLAEPSKLRFKTPCVTFGRPRRQKVLLTLFTLQRSSTAMRTRRRRVSAIRRWVSDRLHSSPPSMDRTRHPDGASPSRAATLAPPHQSTARPPHRLITPAQDWLVAPPSWPTAPPSWPTAPRRRSHRSMPRVAWPSPTSSPPCRCIRRACTTGAPRSQPPWPTTQSRTRGYVAVGAMGTLGRRRPWGGVRSPCSYLA